MNVDVKSLRHQISVQCNRLDVTAEHLVLVLLCTAGTA